MGGIVNRIDRAAWKRMQARAARAADPNRPRLYAVFDANGNQLAGLPKEERTVTFFKGRSCGYTTGLLEQLLDTTAKKSSAGQFSIDELFKDSDQVVPLILAGRAPSPTD